MERVKGKGGMKLESERKRKGRRVNHTIKRHDLF